jgi:hypothetical protein
MSTQPNPKCNDLIDQCLANRLSDILPNIGEWTIDQCKEYISEHGGDTPDDDADADEWHNAARDAHREATTPEPGSVAKLTTYRICLSWGGPADYIELTHDGDDWTGGRYIYQDWFDGAERKIDADTAARLADAFCVGPEFE